MQRGLMQQRGALARPHFGAKRVRTSLCRASGNGNGSTNGHSAAFPTPAETARTIVDLCSEGTLSSITPSGLPIGTPVSYTLEKDGTPILHIAPCVQDCSIDAQQLGASAKCSLLVQPTAHPARAVAAVALSGTAVEIPGSEDGSMHYRLNIERATYYGGLDNAQAAQAVSVESYLEAEPDTLRRSAVDLVAAWNSERAEDVYRIVADHLGLPLMDMTYAELLWVDRLGIYVRCEAAGRESSVVRVPFYRAIIDERDARSVLTMAAQLAWEKERNYTPQLPAIFSEAAAAANN